MTKKPPVARPGVLRFGSRKTTTERVTIKHSYYFCSQDELLYRLPAKVHADLVTGVTGIPTLANCRQRVVEVSIKSDPDPKIAAVKGMFYLFNAKGKLDLHSSTEALTRVLEGDKPQPLQAHVIDIGPLVRSRRWNDEQTWTPGPTLLAALRAEIEIAGKKKAPLFKPV